MALRPESRRNPQLKNTAGGSLDAINPYLLLKWF